MVTPLPVERWTGWWEVTLTFSEDHHDENSSVTRRLAGAPPRAIQTARAIAWPAITVLNKNPKVAFKVLKKKLDRSILGLAQHNMAQVDSEQFGFWVVTNGKNSSDLGNHELRRTYQAAC